jgi:hypothetical protein
MVNRLVVTLLGLVGLLAGCERASEKIISSGTTKNRNEVESNSDAKSIIQCKTPEIFLRRTGITALEITVQIQYEFGYNEKSQSQFKYPASATPIDAYVVTQNGLRILLPNFEIGEGENWTPPSNGCKNFKFIGIGKYALINHFIGTGNPYPSVQDWFVLSSNYQVVPANTLIEQQGFLEADGGDCLLSVVRGDGSSPGQSDKWCSVDDGRKFRRVVAALMLDDQQARRDGQNRYWFTCDRESGTGQASEKIRVDSRTDIVAVLDSDISTRMDRQCEAWAKEAHAY